MKNFSTSVLLALLAVVPLSIAGCGGGSPDGRYPVSGTIMFGGEPMDHGLVSFQPVDPEGKTSSAGRVEKGKYSITGAKTLVPGEYTVVVTCEEVSGETQTFTDAMGKTHSSQKLVTYVPEDWGVFSTHTVTIKAGKNKHDFDIPRNPEPTPPPGTSDGKTDGGA
jgi:hypothetical protein